MPRPRPQLTPAHLKSIAAHSRGQLLDEARQREIDALSASLDQSLAESRVRLQRFEKDLAWWRRYGPWLARVALLPITVVAIGLVLVVGLGLWNGEIHVISKSSRGMISRINSPIGYWFAVVYHSFVATVVSYFAMAMYRFALPKRTPK